MSVGLDLHVFHLLCAKLCHDLVGPVGAVSNGIELIREMGGDDADDALNLVADSADSASNRLKFFRVAYGMAAGVASSTDDAREIASALFSGHKISLDWRLPNEAIGERHVKLLLNLILLASEALVRGGTIAVSSMPSEGGVRFDVFAQGDGARLREETAQGLDTDVDPASLTPRSVQGYFTAVYAHSLGGTVVVDESTPDRVALSSAVRQAG